MQLHFSLSHTHGLVASLIVLENEAGIDIEKINRIDNIESLYENVLTQSEITYLRQFSAEKQKQLFYTFWTLKEAYLKAIGKGLSLSMKEISLYFNSKHGVWVANDNNQQNVSSNWQFISFQPNSNYIGAIAILHPKESRMKINYFEAIPANHYGMTFLPFTPLKVEFLEQVI